MLSKQLCWLCLVGLLTALTHFVVPSGASGNSHSQCLSIAAVPIGNWQMDDDGSTASDCLGSHDGTVHGSDEPRWSTAGVRNGALILDGEDDYVDIGTNSVDTLENYSVAAWVRLRAVDGWQTIVSQDGGNISGFYLQNADDNRWSFSVLSHDSIHANATRSKSTAIALPRRWYFVVGVHDSINQEIRLYVNGRLEDVQSYNSPWPASGNTVIGRAKWSGAFTDYVNGDIDEVSIYDDVLSDIEIEALYKAFLLSVHRVYLMSYFKGSDSKLYYAYSTDGLNWSTINGQNPVFNAYDNNIQIRDPFMQKVNGKFHLVHTKGWDNEEIFHWESTDAITWTGANGGTTTADGEVQAIPVGSAPNAWAPEFFYEDGTYYVFWTTRNYEGVSRERILYRTTTDWEEFSSVGILFDPGQPVIDLTITKSGNTYYGFYKTESGPHNQRHTLAATGNSITSLSGTTDILPTVRGVEGPQVLRLIGGNEWILYYDFFAVHNRTWGASISTNLTNWTEIVPDPDFPPDVRHGSVTIITRPELVRILTHYGDPLPDGWAPPLVLHQHPLNGPRGWEIVETGPVEVPWIGLAKNDQVSAIVVASGYRAPRKITRWWTKLV